MLKEENFTIVVFVNEFMIISKIKAKFILDFLSHHKAEMAPQIDSTNDKSSGGPHKKFPMADSWIRNELLGLKWVYNIKGCWLNPCRRCLIIYFFSTPSNPVFVRSDCSTHQCPTAKTNLGCRPAEQSSISFSVREICPE